MKKYFSMLVVAALGLFTSCSEDALVGGEEGGELTTISVTAPQLGLGTRAGATAFADPALSDMRVALIISTEDNRVITVTTKTHSFGSGSKPCTFEARLYKGKTYNLSVWADYGDTYYTIPTQPTTTAEAEATLPVVKMASTTIAGNVNNYDAYFGNETKTLTGNETINIVLSRPFALVKVNTTDWDENAVKLAGYRPDAYATTFNAPTQLNLVSGVADEAADITTSAEIVEYDQDGNPKQLHYDYLFANTTANILNPFTVVYSQGGTASSDYTFENIPVQRNYQTNITGNILTKNGKINVTITPAWNTPATEIELKEVSTPSVANADLAEHKTETNAKGYIVKTTPNDDNTIIIPENTQAASLAYTLENLGSKNEITVKDETPATPATTYAKEVTLKVPEVTGEKPTVRINTQSAHVTVIGDANVVYANTSENTFVVAEGSTVSKIVVEKGNVAVFGTVTSIVRSTDPVNPDATTIVNLYDGAVWTNWATEKTTANIKPIVNLGTYTFDPTGYNVEGSTVVANEGTPATWSVVVNEEWSSHAAASFSNISGTTITIMTAPELALLAKESEKYQAYTVKLGAYIDLGAYYWNPITTFSGTFDGQNYVISNMKLHGDGYQGLFRNLDGATVKDFVIYNAIADVKGDKCGILAGEVASGSIKNVKIQKSTLTTTGEYAGAIFGIGYSAVDGCEVTECSITGKEQVGAALGYMWVGSIQNCKATKNTIAAASRAGGLIGKVQFAKLNIGPDQTSKMWINNNTISGTVTATEAIGGIAGQIMGDDPRFEILNNSIDVPGTNCPIGTLRAKQSTEFTSVLAEKITGNTWTKATLDAKRYTYTNAETGAGDQIIWNGEPEDNWQWYAAKSFSQIDETNKIITITSPEELALLAKKINKDPLNANVSNTASCGAPYRGYTIKLAADINLGAHVWTPICTFSATLDGQNHTISNMLVNADNGYGNAFISYGYNSVIKNVTFDNATVKRASKDCSGNIYAVVMAYAGYYANATFEGVTVKNSLVNGFGKVGAIAGMAEMQGHKLLFKDCKVEGTTLRGAYNVGGFIGNFQYWVSDVRNTIKFEGTNTSDVTLDAPTFPYAGFGQPVTVDGLTGNYLLYGEGPWYYAQFAKFYCEYDAPGTAEKFVDAFIHDTPDDINPE